MNIEFIFVVFCLTLVALVAMVLDKERIVEIALNAIAGVQQSMRGLVEHLRHVRPPK